MKGFTKQNVRTLRLLADVLLPPGHVVPGATEVGVDERLARRAAMWGPALSSRVAWLVRAWELSPVLSRHLRPFSRLTAGARHEWVHSCYSSGSGARRMHLAALKQLVFLEWASTPEVEDAMGYDYTCRADDVVRGAGRAIEVLPPQIGRVEEPADYMRPGPATASGAIPMDLLSKRASTIGEISHLHVTAWPELQPGRHERTQVLVIGSGAGGAVVATTLAEAGIDVIVVEEGRHVTAHEDFHGPMFDRFQRFCRDRGFTQAWGTPPIPMPLGRVVGGTTVVNSGTCFRAPDRVLRRWVDEYHVPTAEPAAIAARYAPIEEFLSVRPVPWELLGPNGMAAHRGAVALGYSGGPLLRNIGDCRGCGQCAFGCPTNAKQAMHISYLPRAQRAGARVYSGCRVDRIRMDGARATGITATVLDLDDRPRGELTIDAAHVVVCAGAIQTPVLLSTSGAPDPSGQVGRNLRIHPATGVGAFFDDDIVNWKGTLQSYYIDQFFDSHELMFEATTTIPSIGAGSMPGIGPVAMEEMARFRQLATLGFYVSDTSAGRVRRGPGGEAVVTYKMNALDAHRMGVGIAVAAEVLLEAGAARVFPGLPGLDWISARDDLVSLRERRVDPGHLRLTAFHPMGTVRMGADPDSAVVNEYGRHHQLENLWVADASTFPSCVGVNPQMTIMAFAKNTGDRVISTL